VNSLQIVVINHVGVVHAELCMLLLKKLLVTQLLLAHVLKQLISAKLKEKDKKQSM